MRENVNDAPTNMNNLEFSEASPHNDYLGGQKRGNEKSVIWTLLDEYFSSASINGVQYFTKRQRHWSERLFWVIAFIISICLSGYLISDPWRKWRETPVIVSFDEKSTPIWDIPFPTVTICPVTKFNKTKLKYTEAYLQLSNWKNSSSLIGNLSNDTITKMRAAAQICEPFRWHRYDSQNSANISVVDILNDISITREETIISCKRSLAYGCMRSFKPILTEEGICFTLNSLNSRDIYTDAIDPEMLTVKDNPNATHWNLEQGYTDHENNHKTYPYRVPAAGVKIGLNVGLQTFKKNFDYTCSGSVQGFKIVLHTPDEVPQVSKYFFRVPLDQEVLVSVQPQMTTTKDPNLSKYEPKIRGCFFNAERSLKFFKSYTQRNCQLECLANFTLTKCGCVKLAMPRVKDTPLCGVFQLVCSEWSEYIMLRKNLNEGSEREHFSNFCDCLPACTSIAYDADISQAKLDHDRELKAYGLNINSDNDNSDIQVSQLSIFFKEHQFTPSRRTELYGITDFLANCGGLLGLCIGISVLGIVEVIYFFTLRLCCTLRMQRRRC